MSITQVETIFKQRMKHIIEDQSSENPRIPIRLKEKGVECTILMPLFEDILGFDPVHDIEYELSSDKVHGQRFDFLMDGCFVVEAKALNVVLTGKLVDQIAKYIELNDHINYGMLTNGIEYVFFIQKIFIEKVANAGNEIVGATKRVYNVLTIDVEDEYFIDLIQLFSKQTYDEVFRRIAKFAFRQLVVRKGPKTAIAEDRELDAYIKTLIEKRMDFKQGHYLDKIRSGEYRAGQKLLYADQYVEITIELQADGTVKLPRNGIKVDANAILATGEFKPILTLITEWHDKEQTFQYPKDIFRQALGKAKIAKKYIFKPF